MQRIKELKRETSETKIELKINLDGTGKSEVKTGIKFFDHLLRTLSFYSLFDLSINAFGDLKHHLIEDVGIILGKGFNEANSKSLGIKRFGYACIPMDDSLVSVAVDCGCDRSYVSINLNFSNEFIEDMSIKDFVHFLYSFGQNAQINLHIDALKGVNDHHKAEAAMKALGIALREAISLDPKRTGKKSSLKNE
ncbi:MAG: imidazoleglycerol-phosphate dehydratase HisB [Candidatus Bathyarchaeia archaeon]